MSRIGSLSVRILILLAIIAGQGLLIAFVHEGRDAAIAEALPKLDLKDNPYIPRESWWHGELKDKETKTIKCQLFKRNDYWFWVGSSNPAVKFSLHIYDSKGNLVEEESYQKGHVAGAKVVPKTSGTFYIRIKNEGGAAGPTEWAVIYAFR